MIHRNQISVKKKTEKRRQVIGHLKNAHKFVHSSLEGREMLVSPPEESLSIINHRVNPAVLPERGFSF
jgi:hypothetical protein